MNVISYQFLLLLLFLFTFGLENVQGNGLLVLFVLDSLLPNSTPFFRVKALKKNHIHSTVARKTEINIFSRPLRRSEMDDLFIVVTFLLGAVIFEQNILKACEN